MAMQEGDECDADSINEALGALNATGLFEKVDIARKGTVLVVTVKEHPIINKFQFEGNSKIKDAVIKKIVRLKEREILSPVKIKEIQQILLEVYRQHGLYNASVDQKIIKLDNNCVNLIFEINEGTAAGIGRIVFIGNDRVSAGKLRDVIYSKVKRWYRFFVTDDIFNSGRLDEDKAAIERYYHNDGYADARVVSAVAELARNKREFTLTFVVDEGEQYKFGDIRAKSHIAKLKDEDLKVDFYCKRGNVYNAGLIGVDNAAIVKKAGIRGFAAIKAEPDIKRNKETRTADVTFDIREGERIYISKIVIKGNVRTRDHIIRRELALEEGDAYNQALVALTENNLWGLGFFKAVNIEAVPDPNVDDKCILQITVEETSTGAITFSGSYSTQTGFGMDLGFEERNIFGSGKAFSLSVSSGKSLSGKGTEVDENGKVVARKSETKFKIFNNVSTSLSDPRLFGKDMEGSIGAFISHGGGFNSISSREMGFTLGISCKLSPKFSQRWSYIASKRDFNSVAGYASPVIKYMTMKEDKNAPGGVGDVYGKCGLSSIEHTIGYHTAFLTGLKGRFGASLSTGFAGLGGDAKYLKNRLFTTYVMPVTRKTDLQLSVSFGTLNRVGSKCPNIIDSFSLGMDSFRGFELSGLGPVAETRRRTVDKSLTHYVPGEYTMHRENIGATKQCVLSAEYSFPLGMPEELGVRGFVFSDVGSCWSAPCTGEKEKLFEKTGQYLKGKDGKPLKDENGKEFEEMKCEFDQTLAHHRVLDSKKIRVSAGLGVSFVTPIGPMHIAYAVPIRKEKYDEQFRVLIGCKTTY
jgi:outer membrane protein insertion porin family